MKIGKQIRNMRRRAGISLSELSVKSGVAMATLSRIEHEKMTGTLDAHLEIAKALGITLSELYKDIEIENQKVSLLEEKDHTDVFIHNDKASCEILTMNVLRKKMMPVMLKIEPQGQTNLEQGPSGSEKFIYLLEGSMEVIIGDKNHLLKQGDTLYFEAYLPHYFKNTGEVLTKGILVTTPTTL